MFLQFFNQSLWCFDIPCNATFWSIVGVCPGSLILLLSFCGSRILFSPWLMSDCKLLSGLSTHIYVEVVFWYAACLFLLTETHATICLNAVTTCCCSVTTCQGVSHCLLLKLYSTILSPSSRLDEPLAVALQCFSWFILCAWLISVASNHSYSLAS